VEAFDLARGLRMVGMAVLLRDAQAGEQVLEAVVAAGETRGVNRPVVSEGRVRKPVGIGCGQEGGDHVLTADPWPSNGVRRYREWSSSQLMISTSMASASCQWVKSDCQHSLGWSASNCR
jgi:hypothetical protein